MNRTLLKLIVISSIIVFLAGCDTKETVADIDKKAVDRWNALIEGDYEKAYSYIAPSYRQLESSESYQMRMKTATLHTTWNEADFVSKQCAEETCEVQMKIIYTYQFPKRSLGKVKAPTQLKEHWLKSDGKWYYLPKEKVTL